MDKIIEVYDNNTLTLTVEVDGITDLSGFTCTFYVVKNRGDVTALIMNTGTTVLNVINFGLSELETSLPSGKYVYEVRCVSGLATYTVCQGEFIVKDSIVTSPPK